MALSVELLEGLGSVGVSLEEFLFDSGSSSILPIY